MALGSSDPLCPISSPLGELTASWRSLVPRLQFEYGSVLKVELADGLGTSEILERARSSASWRSWLRMYCLRAKGWSGVFDDHPEQRETLGEVGTGVLSRAMEAPSSESSGVMLAKACSGDLSPVSIGYSGRPWGVGLSNKLSIGQYVKRKINEERDQLASCAVADVAESLRTTG